MGPRIGYYQGVRMSTAYHQLHNMSTPPPFSFPTIERKYNRIAVLLTRVEGEGYHQKPKVLQLIVELRDEEWLLLRNDMVAYTTDPLNLASDTWRKSRLEWIRDLDMIRAFG